METEEEAAASASRSPSASVASASASASASSPSSSSYLLRGFAPVAVEIQSSESLRGVPSPHSDKDRDTESDKVRELLASDSPSNSQSHLQEFLEPTPHVTVSSTKHLLVHDDDDLFGILDATYSPVVNKPDLSISDHVILAAHSPQRAVAASPQKAIASPLKTTSADKHNDNNDDEVTESVSKLDQSEVTESKSELQLHHDTSYADLKIPDENKNNDVLVTAQSVSAKKLPKKDKLEAEDSSHQAARAKKSQKQMVEEAESLAMQAKKTKQSQLQAQKELKENRLDGISNNKQRKEAKDKDKDTKNAGDKSERPEATDRSERESKEPRVAKAEKSDDKEKEKLKDKRPLRRRSVPKPDEVGDPLPSNEPQLVKLPPVKGSGAVQKLLAKVSAASPFKIKDPTDAEKRVNEKIAAAEKVKLPKIRLSKNQHQQQMMSKDDSHDEEDVNDEDSVAPKIKQPSHDGQSSGHSLLEPPHSSPAGSQTNKRKSKRPLFMRMIAKARQKIMEEERSKQDEYKKLKENRPQRVPTRNELKEHRHKFDEMMKHHQDQQQKNHVENIRALRQARKKMAEKLGSIESVIDDGSEADPDQSVVSGTDGTPSPKKKFKIYHKEKSSPKVSSNNNNNNNDNDVDDPMHEGDDQASASAPASSKQNNQHNKHQIPQSPLKKRNYITPTKVEILSPSSAHVLSPRDREGKTSPRGKPKEVLSEITTPRTKSKNSKADLKDHHKQEVDGDTQFSPRSLFTDKDIFREKEVLNDDEEIAVTNGEIATEVTSDWFGRLLSTETLMLMD